VQSVYFVIPGKFQVAARYSWWDPDTNAAGDLIKQVDVALSYYLSGTYDHQIQIQYTNLFMGMGGFAIGRSAPLPNGPLPIGSSTNNNNNTANALDSRQRNLIENAIRVQYAIFF
jgi:hypothetical protein